MLIFSILNVKWFKCAERLLPLIRKYLILFLERILQLQQTFPFHGIKYLLLRERLKIRSSCVSSNDNLLQNYGLI